MNEPWEQNLKPESIKVSEQLGKRDDGMIVKVPIISTKVNWDDTLARVASNILHFFWRSK